MAILLTHYFAFSSKKVNFERSRKKRRFKFLKLTTLMYGLIFMIFTLSCNLPSLDPESLTQEQPQTGTLKSATIGRVFFVSPTGNNNYLGTEAAPFLTIAKAASVVTPGDEVIVEDGTYTGPAGKFLVIISASGNSTANITFKARNKGGAVLDGRNNSSIGGISIKSSYINIEGFEVKGFSEFGIEVRNKASHVNIRDIHVHDIGRLCTDDGMGLDALYLNSCSYITVERCLINDIGRFGPGEGCSYSSGWTGYSSMDHGIYNDGCSYLTIKNNVFFNIKSGWALQCYSGDKYAMTDINFINNTCDNGNPFSNQPWGHLVLFGNISNVLIANNIFKDQFGAAVGIYANGSTYSNVLITKNITYGGTGTTSFGTAAGVSTTGNYNSTDPLFTNEVNHDYSLQSNSPATNAGYDTGVSTDYLSNARTVINIGAYAPRSSANVPVVPVVSQLPVASGASVLYAGLFYNTQISAAIAKNDCGTGYTGSTVTYTVPANKYYSSISQADANAYATIDINANKQAYANANGTCTSTSGSGTNTSAITSTGHAALYYNIQTSAAATKNDCGSGYTGSTVTYTVPANKYYSSISQADANAYATNDITANKQAYANANGTCTSTRVGPVVLYYNTQTSATATKNNCGTGYTGSTVTYTVPANKYYSSISQADANAYATNDITANKQAYANANGTCKK